MSIAACCRYVYMAELGAETLNIYARKSDNALSLMQVGYHV